MPIQFPEKLTQEAVNEIAAYLKSFKDGTRKHEQGTIHSGCGTAHCLAGWKVVDDYVSEIGSEPDDYTLEESYDLCLVSDTLKLFCRQKIGQRRTLSEVEWEYAQRAWGLSEREGDLLFEGWLKLFEMIENLRGIADSHNLACPDI